MDYLLPAFLISIVAYAYWQRRSTMRMLKAFALDMEEKNKAIEALRAKKYKPRHLEIVK